jgi:hypothetical protein
MKPLLETVYGLCLLRAGPQDLPHSTSLLQAMALLSVVVTLVVGSILFDPADLLLPALIGLVLLLALPAIALNLAGRSARFAQTAIALLACDVAFTLLYAPLALGMGKLPASAEQMTGSQRFFALLVLVLIGWQLAVRGNILRHALELPLRTGLLIAVVFFAIEQLLPAALWPAAG